MIKEKRITGRRVAMTYVYQALLLDENINELQKNLELDEGYINLDDNTKRFIVDLIKQTLEHQAYLEDKINPLLKTGWRMDRLSKVEQAILHLGSYEILFSDTPKKVIIDEYVNLSKRFCDATSYKFINAVIDQIERNE